MIVPFPSREDLDNAHLGPLSGPGHSGHQAAGSCLSAKGGWHRHLSAAWDLAVEAQGVQASLCISFRCPHVIQAGSNLPEGLEMVGTFAYGLLSGHEWGQRTPAGIWEEGRVSTAGIIGLIVVTGGRSEGQNGWAWHALPCASMRGGSGVARGGLRSLTPRGRRTPPPALLLGNRKHPPPRGHWCAPPQGPAYRHHRGLGTM